MIDNETIDSYLIQMDLPVHLLREGIWRIDDPDDRLPPIIISHESPIVYVRLKVIDLPPFGREALFERLLRLNASGIAFGAYAVEDDQVILLDTLRSDSLQLTKVLKN